MRRINLHEDIFEAYKAAGQELSMGELRRVLGGMSTSREGWQKAMKKCQRVYKSRWHEIYDTKLGIVHEPAPAPVQESEPAPEPKLDVDPLLALRKARVKKREEHE